VWVTSEPLHGATVAIPIRRKTCTVLVVANDLTDDDFTRGVSGMRTTSPGDIFHTNDRNLDARWPATVMFSVRRIVVSSASLIVIPSGTR
jgi:hypothetical protein